MKNQINLDIYKKDLPLWFRNLLKKVMAHNEYEEADTTATECGKKDRWTPCDLIVREYLNNGGGSSKGFLGVSPSDCKRGYWFIKEHQQELRALDLYNKDGWNNCGCPLWKNYEL